MAAFLVELGGLWWYGTCSFIKADVGGISIQEVDQKIDQSHVITMTPLPSKSEYYIRF